MERTDLTEALADKGCIVEEVTFELMDRDRFHVEIERGGAYFL